MLRVSMLALKSVRRPAVARAAVAAVPALGFAGKQTKNKTETTPLVAQKIAKISVKPARVAASIKKKANVAGAKKPAAAKRAKASTTKKTTVTKRAKVNTKKAVTKLSGKRTAVAKKSKPAKAADSVAKTQKTRKVVRKPRAVKRQAAAQAANAEDLPAAAADAFADVELQATYDLTAGAEAMSTPEEEVPAEVELQQEAYGQVVADATAAAIATPATPVDGKK